MGASMRVSECAASSAPRDRVSNGEEEDVSTIMVPCEVGSSLTHARLRFSTNQASVLSRYLERPELLLARLCPEEALSLRHRSLGTS
jgi:hypothetical protein